MASLLYINNELPLGDTIRTKNGANINAFHAFGFLLQRRHNEKMIRSNVQNGDHNGLLEEARSSELLIYYIVCEIIKKKSFCRGVNYRDNDLRQRGE